jgi:hypothetical protein
MRCCNSPPDVWIRVHLFSLSDLWKDEEKKLSLSLSLSYRCVEDGIPVSSGHASRNLIRKGYMNQVCCFSLIDLLVSFLLNDVEEFFLCCRCAEEGIHSYVYQEIL